MRLLSSFFFPPTSYPPPFLRLRRTFLLVCGKNLSYDPPLFDDSVFPALTGLLKVAGNLGRRSPTPPARIPGRILVSCRSAEFCKPAFGAIFFLFFSFPCRSRRLPRCYYLATCSRLAWRFSLRRATSPIYPDVPEDRGLHFPFPFPPFP